MKKSFFGGLFGTGAYSQKVDISIDHYRQAGKLLHKYEVAGYLKIDEGNFGSSCHGSIIASGRIFHVNRAVDMNGGYPYKASTILETATNLHNLMQIRFPAFDTMKHEDWRRGYNDHIVTREWMEAKEFRHFDFFEKC